MGYSGHRSPDLTHEADHAPAHLLGSGGPFPLADPSAATAGSFVPSGIYVPPPGLTWNGIRPRPRSRLGPNEDIDWPPPSIPI